MQIPTYCIEQDDNLYWVKVLRPYGNWESLAFFRWHWRAVRFIKRQQRQKAVAPPPEIFKGDPN